MMKVGEVVEILRKEFPSVSISRIRFLENQGLIKIKRTKGGTRDFTEENISLIRKILSLQEKQHITLKAIKDNPSIIKNFSDSIPKKSYTLSDSLRSSGINSKMYNDLVKNNLEVYKDTYTYDDIERLKSWNYLLSKGIKINNTTAIQGISNRGAPYLEQIAKSNNIPKAQLEDLSKHLGIVLGGTIYLHME